MTVFNMKKNKPHLIDLSMMSIIKFFVVILVLLFLFFIRDIILILFVSFILTAAFLPAVDFLAHKKIPRPVSVLFIFILIISIIGIIISLLIPPLTSQFSELSANWPAYSDKIQTWVNDFQQYFVDHGQQENINEFFSSITHSMSVNAGSVFETITGLFGGLAAFLVVLVITFYLLVDQDSTKKTLKAVLPARFSLLGFDLIAKIQIKIVDWLKGQLILSFIVGLLVYLGLLILGVEYALILGLVAFLGEFVPYLGPVFAAIPALFFAFVESPILAVFVLILFIVIQQAENHVLVPKIMQKAVGLNPIVSIVALLIGAKLAGWLGILLAIPVATALSVVIKEFYFIEQTK